MEGMELNYWTATEFEGGAYNEKEGAMVRHAPIAALSWARKMRCTRACDGWPPVSGVSSLPQHLPTLHNSAGLSPFSSIRLSDRRSWRASHGDSAMMEGQRVLVVGSAIWP